MKIQRYRVLRVSFVAFTMVVAGCGEPDVATSPAMDAIEQELESARHAELLKQISATDGPASEFETDGCSGGLSAAWQQISDQYPEFEIAHGGRPPWEACCVAHDRQYHSGGVGAASAIDSFERRRIADMTLRACVIDTADGRSESLQRIYGLSIHQIDTLYEMVADLMYRAVRLGGIPCTRKPWRWGYGWPECGYHEQSEPARGDLH